MFGHDFLLGAQEKLLGKPVVALGSTANDAILPRVYLNVIFDGET